MRNMFFFQLTNSNMLFIPPLNGFVFHENSLGENNKPHESNKTLLVLLFFSSITFTYFWTRSLKWPAKIGCAGVDQCACYGLKPEAINLGHFPAGIPSFSTAELTMGLVLLEWQCGLIKFKISRYSVLAICISHQVWDFTGLLGALFGLKFLRKKVTWNEQINV